MSNCSFITMSSEEVTKLATECIVAIDELRDEMRQRLLIEDRNNWMNRFFRWAFRCPDPTDEQIIAAWNMRNGFENPLSHVEMTYGQQYTVAHALLESAKYAPAVNVSVADLAIIQGK